MKLNITFLLVISVFSFGSLSCSSTGPTATAGNNAIQPEKPAKEIPAAKEPSPKIVFESKLLELGQIGPEAKAVGEFRFTNEGDAALEIRKISQCCGVVISYEKNKYEPGEKGIINVTYTASKNAEKISRNPVVSSNDPSDPDIILLITAEIVNKVVAKPASLKLFLDEDNAACPKLTVSSIDGQAFAVRGIQSTGNCITAQVDPNVKGTQIELDLKADIEKLRQNKNGYVEVIVTHSEMSIVQLTFDVLSRYSVIPPQITALDVEAAVPYERDIWIYNKYEQKFEVESISSKNNYITVVEDSKTVVNDGYQFKIRIMPPPRAGKISFNDELYIQIKNGEKLKVEYSGYYVLSQTSETKKDN